MSTALHNLVARLSSYSLQIRQPDYQQTLAAVAECNDLLHIVMTRLQTGVEAPLLVSFLGGTGVGKSTIFNTLVGEPLARTSVMRPCTERPFIYYHERDAQFVETGSKSSILSVQGDATLDLQVIEFERRSHRFDELQDIIFIDSPDFDSLEATNRHIAHFIFQRSDLIVFVTSPARYADEAQWLYLRRAGLRNRQYWIVLNQLADTEVSEDFAAKLAKESLGVKTFLFTYDPGALDHGLLDNQDERISQFKAALVQLAADGRKQSIQLAELDKAITAIAEQLHAVIGPAVDRETQTLATLRVELETNYESRRTDLSYQLKHVIGDEARDRLNALFRENIRTYADPFRALRRTILSPVLYLGNSTITFLKKLGLKSDLANPKTEVAIEEHHNFNSEVVWQTVKTLQDIFLANLAEIEFLNPPRLKQALEESQLPRAQVFELYEQGKADLAHWLRKHFDLLTHDIRKKKSVQLTLIQLLWLGLIIGMEFGTGGGFVLIEGIIDLAVFPLISPLLMKAISWEQYKVLVREAARKHQDLCFSILNIQFEKYSIFLQTLQQTVPTSTELFSQFESLVEEIKRDGWKL